MDKPVKPIFKNDLTPEEQKKQDAIVEKEKEERVKLQKVRDIIDAVVGMIEILTDFFR